MTYIQGLTVWLPDKEVSSELPFTLPSLTILPATSWTFPSLLNECRCPQRGYNNVRPAGLLQGSHETKHKQELRRGPAHGGHVITTTSATIASFGWTFSMELSGTSPPARLGWALQSLDAPCLQCPRLSVGPSPRPPLVMGALALGLLAGLPHTFLVLSRLRPREGKPGRGLPETRFGRAETTPGGGAHRGHSAPRSRASAQGRTRLLPWGSRGIPAPTSHVGKLRPGQGQRSHIGGPGVPACKVVLTGVGTYATRHTDHRSGPEQNGASQKNVRRVPASTSTTG